MCTVNFYVGFMIMDDIIKIYPKFFQEFIFLMQKFEVVFRLDKKRLLIPSLLPQDEEDACLVFSSTLCYSKPDNAIFDHHLHEPHAPMYETPHPIFTRYYLLPFVPNGFFTRLMARLMSGDIIDHLQLSLINNKLGANHIINSTHWKCWRTGILITWNHMEIFRIAPLSSAPTGANKLAVVTKKDAIIYTDVSVGLEIKVAMLPDEYIGKCSTLQGQFNSSTAEADKRRCGFSAGKCLATWLLHQATTTIDSVFEDWYESFARKKGFDPHQDNVRITNPCNKCIEHVQGAQLRQSRMPYSLAVDPSAAAAAGAAEKLGTLCYVFTSTYIALVSSSGEQDSLLCPAHGTLRVADVAPDLVGLLIKY